MILITCDGEVAALAAYKLADGDVRVVHEFAADSSVACGLASVVNLMLDELEAACCTEDCRSVIVVTAGVPPALLTRRGYVPIVEGCAGAWLEKRLRDSKRDGWIH